MPLTISNDRGQVTVDPATLPPGTICKVYGTVPVRFRQGLTSLAVPAGNLLSLTSVAGIAPGFLVSGTGIAAGATVAAVSGSASKVRLSAVVTGTVALGATITFSKKVLTTAASATGTTLTLPTTGLSVGQAVSGTNIPAGATVQSITNATSLVLSAAVTSTGVDTGAEVTFTTTRVTSAATTPASTASLGLQVTLANPPAVIGNGYQNSVGAMVYNRTKTTPTALARAVARGWALIPLENINPTGATYV